MTKMIFSPPKFQIFEDHTHETRMSNREDKSPGGSFRILDTKVRERFPVRPYRNCKSSFPVKRDARTAPDLNRAAVFPII